MDPTEKKREYNRNYSKIFYHENRDEVNKKAKEHYSIYKNDIKNKQKLYYQKNRDKIKEKNRLRYHIKKAEKEREIIELVSQLNDERFIAREYFDPESNTFIMITQPYKDWKNNTDDNIIKTII